LFIQTGILSLRDSIPCTGDLRTERRVAWEAEDRARGRQKYLSGARAPYRGERPGCLGRPGEEQRPEVGRGEAGRGGESLHRSLRMSSWRERCSWLKR
jgi:hypothetical protein